MNVIIEIQNARWEFIEFLQKHDMVIWYNVFMYATTDITHVYYEHKEWSDIWNLSAELRRWQTIPLHWQWVKATVSEFIVYYEWRKKRIDTIDTRYMPDVAWPDDYWTVTSTVTKDSKWNVTHLHTKFNPIMNYYNTAVVRRETTENKKLKCEDNVVIWFKVRLGKSEDNIKAQILREIPEDEDIDTLNIMIEPIF